MTDDSGLVWWILWAALFGCFVLGMLVGRYGFSA